MGLCFVSRTLGLQRFDGCRCQPVQARKKQEWRKGEATMEGKRSERVVEGTGGRGRGLGRGSGDGPVGGPGRGGWEGQKEGEKEVKL